MSFIEGLCLVAIGAAMVELHDNQRFERQGAAFVATPATAAKPVRAAGEVRIPESASSRKISEGGYR
ncbi:MAG TPA: hypothetical protein VMU96_05740 [Casimicrobiaceae bacterium]|nr:hypothetical protein [Casimicrobiaceae bacterium]